jgi:hypothetical protein
LFPSNGARKLVGYFKREQKKICKRTDTDVAFTQEYSRVSISTGNTKCTRIIRNVQGKGNYRVERVLGFSKWFYLVEGLLYFTYFGAVGPFQLSKKTRKTVVGRRLPKLYENTNPNVVDYKGLTELSPLGLLQLSRGFGANSGKP